MKANENEILTIAGKRVRVAYCKPGEDCCARCCFSFGGGETCVGLDGGEEWPCGKFDLATAYFVPADESPTTTAEEDDARERQRNGLPAYSPVFNQASLDKKIDAFSETHKGETAEQFEAACRGEEAPARPANPFIPDQGLTIDGKRYEKRYFRIGDACSRCAFKVGEDANGHARCKDHGKPEKPCTPDREKGVLVYFIAADADVNKWAVTNAFLHCEKAGKIVSEMYGDKLNNPRNRDKYLAFLTQVNLDDRFGELSEILQRYGAMPAPKEQPEADLEVEAERFFKKFPMRANTPGVPDEYLDFETYMLIARHFAEWGAEHLKK